MKTKAEAPRHANKFWIFHCHTLQPTIRCRLHLKTSSIKQTFILLDVNFWAHIFLILRVDNEKYVQGSSLAYEAWCSSPGNRFGDGTRTEQATFLSRNPAFIRRGDRRKNCGYWDSGVGKHCLKNEWREPASYFRENNTVFADDGIRAREHAWKFGKFVRVTGSLVTRS